LEILFYVGMVIWGFYLLCTETVEDIERDFYGAEYTATQLAAKQYLESAEYKGGK